MSNEKNGLKSIDTYYNGYLFRSRLEARWAVFYDSLGIKYEYEKEGYNLSCGWYLPDFWLPELEYWIEIKGQEATQQEMLKVRILCLESSHSVFIFDQGAIEIDDGRNPMLNNAKAFFISDDGRTIEDEGYIWCQCPVCNKFGMSFSGYANRICDCKDTKDGRYDLLELAYINARKKRFEHKTDQMNEDEYLTGIRGIEIIQKGNLANELEKKMHVR